MDGSQRDLIDPENDPFAVNPPARSQAQPAQPAPYQQAPAPRYASPQYAPIPAQNTPYQNQPAPYSQQQVTPAHGYISVQPQQTQRQTPPGWVTGPQSAVQ
jgi:hypothetical protein